MYWKLNKDNPISDNHWLVGQGQHVTTKRLGTLREIFFKAKQVLRKDTIFSLDNWKFWLKCAREEFRLHKYSHDYNPNLSKFQNDETFPECIPDYKKKLDRKLKVVFFSHNLNYEGAPNILLEVVRGLKTKNRIIPVIVSINQGPQPQYKDLIAEGFCVHQLPVLKQNNMLDIEQGIKRVRDFLLEQKPDLVVTNVLVTFFVVEASMQLGLPTLWWIHESYEPATMVKNLPPKSFPWVKKALNDVTMTLFVSRETSHLYKNYNQKLNYRVIHNSLDVNKIKGATTSANRIRARKELSLDSLKKVIVSVGTVCERKNQITLVEAAKILSQTHDDFIFYLVGYRESLKYGTYIFNQIKKYQLEDVVKLIPETPNVEQYYLAADIFAFSSLNESYSLTILEAMAYGLPIVTTRCFGITEQVRFGTNALEVDFKNPIMFAQKISILLDDQRKRKRFGKNSLEIMRYMQSKEEMLEKHETLLFSLYYLYTKQDV